MKFREFLENNQINEWKDFYIDFLLLKNIIKPFSKNYKKKLKAFYQKKINAKQHFKSIQSQELLDELIYQEDNDNEIAFSKEQSIKIQKAFLSQMILELSKVDFFSSYNINNRYKPRLSSLNEQMEFVEKNKQYKVHKEILELAVKELYKEIILLKDFIELNLRVKEKLIKKFQKLSKFIPSEMQIDIEQAVSDYLSSSEILNDPIKKCTELLSECEKLFFYNYNEKYEGQVTKILKEYVTPVSFTQEQAFYLGFFVGLLVIQLLVIYVIAHNFHIDIDDDEGFKSIFPMFRSFGIICLYLWFLGLNVWAWNKAHINYKACFNFTNHYSDVISIFKRAACFSFLLLCGILCYLIIRTGIPILYDIVSFIPIELIPLICWIILVGYLFFPFNYFNYPGRMYTLMLFIESVASILVKTEFRHEWFMDQLTSLIGPMRDMEYTVCFYAYYQQPFEVRQAFCSSNRLIFLCIGIFPNLCRILQCLRIILDTKVVSPKIYNIGKYSFNILVALFSFLWVAYPICHTLWWITALISTVYSYFWDIKFDFGFLQEGQSWPLRDKLSYKNHFFYYFTITTNLFLRFLWILSLSPEVMAEFIRPEFLALILFILEAFRRWMWNFIRVELKHIDLCKEFKVTSDIELPFIKKNGKLVPTGMSILAVMKMDREDRIQIELGKLKKEPAQVEKIIQANENIVVANPEPDNKQDLVLHINEYKYETQKNLDKLKQQKMEDHDPQTESTRLIIQHPRNVNLNTDKL